MAALSSPHSCASHFTTLLGSTFSYTVLFSTYCVRTFLLRTSCAAMFRPPLRACFNEPSFSFFSPSRSLVSFSRSIFHYSIYEVTSRSRISLVNTILRHIDMDRLSSNFCLRPILDCVGHLICVLYMSVICVVVHKWNSAESTLVSHPISI